MNYLPILDRLRDLRLMHGVYIRLLYEHNYRKLTSQLHSTPLLLLYCI